MEKVQARGQTDLDSEFGSAVHECGMLDECPCFSKPNALLENGPNGTSSGTSNVPPRAEWHVVVAQGGKLVPTTRQTCAVSVSCPPQLVYKTDPDGAPFYVGCTWLSPRSQIWRWWHPEVSPLTVLLHRSGTSMELSTLSGEQTGSPPIVRTSAGESLWWWAPPGQQKGSGGGEGTCTSTHCKPSCQCFWPTAGL